MSDITRREAFTALAALAAASSTLPAAAQAPAQAPSDPAATLITPRIFPFASLPVKMNPNGSESRSVLSGVLPTGEAIEVHESTIPVGATPNPAHAHRMSDLIMVREGTLVFEHDGQPDPQPIGPGGILFVASQTNHTVRNVGSVPAKYFVVVIGRDSPRQLG